MNCRKKKNHAQFTFDHRAIIKLKNFSSIFTKLHFEFK